MGYWHTSNTGSNVPSSSVLKVDTAICTDTCSLSLCGFSSSEIKRPDRATRRPLVDFAGSYALLSSTDYAMFPDLQMFPAVGGAAVPIYNIPALSYLSPVPLVLSRSTIASIFLGKSKKSLHARSCANNSLQYCEGNIRYWNDSRILSGNTGAVKMPCKQ